VAAGYYLGCLAGFAWRFPSSGISFFWPPTAVLTAGLALTGAKSWPAFLAASFVAHAAAHAQNGVPFAAWPVQFLGNAIQAMLAAFVLRHYSVNASPFSNLRQVLAFVVGACVVAPAAASLIPAYVYVRQGWAPGFSDAWLVRFISNAVATLTLVPSLMMAWHFLSTRATNVVRRPVELGLLLLGGLGVHAIVGLIARTDVLGLSVALYAPVPILLWATIRFGRAGLSFALLWTTLLTISTAFTDRGPLATGATTDTVIGVQLVIMATAIPMMLIAGLLEQYRTEHAALLEAERQNAAILDAHPDLMFLQTIDGVFLQFHAKNSAHLLVRPDSFIGRNMHAVLPPDLADRFAEAFKTLTPEQPAVLEYTLAIDGTPRRYEARCISVANDRVLSLVRDITDRWRAESALRETRQRYALASAAGGVGVWDLDVQTGQVRVEGGLQAILGYGDADVGSTLADWQRLISPADRADVDARLTSYVSGASPKFEAEFRMLHKDGSARWIVSKAAVTDHLNGAPIRVTGTFADTTERNQSARALQDANDAVLRLARIAALAELSASIAHELKQPLMAIAANANACLLWIDGTQSTELRNALTDVVTDVRRANHIVERTHEMFTNQPARRRAVNVNALIGNILEIVGGRLRESDVTLDLRLDEHLPAAVADAVQIQQVLLNLIVNGVEAMQGTTDQARLLRITSRRGRKVMVVSVRDTGTGFESADVRRVFEPFYTTKASGVGMGLAISRAIITSHGGSLWAVANATGRGATVRLTLPIVAEPASEPAVMTGGKRVLIVDDHDGMRRAMTRLIRTWGHTVAVASDGATALSQAERFHPDVVVLDLSLDDMRGIDLGRRLRELLIPSPLVLIALTASTDADMREACLTAGFDAYLTKGGGIGDLERLLASA
jgi:PAS domain S-box-containing protein